MRKGTTVKKGMSAVEKNELITREVLAQSS